jgi:cell division transport system permease protein
MWYGLCGGLMAWLLIAISLGIMAQPLERLATLYQSSYQISSLSAGDISMLILISCLLGLGGSWLAVGRHLSEIEPS